MKSAHVREWLEAHEESLSPYAIRSRESKGRARHETPSHVRTEFQRDRDRIIHTNSFRRLNHKSQVFIAPQGDHYATRLVHTVEVAQIGRTIARALNLNEDLVEAAALGHDLGHSPFGHVGERVLNRLVPGGFHHSRQSVRIVEVLEKDGRGLNLTREVVEAIGSHSKPPPDEFPGDAVAAHLSLEAQVLRIADSVAYLTHDIADAVRSGRLTLDDLPRGPMDVLGKSHSGRVNTLVTDIVEASWDAGGRAEVPETRPLIRASAKVEAAMRELRGFMFEHFYLPVGESSEGQAARDVVALLYEHYATHPDQVPERTREIAGNDERAAADYVCGMTDLFAPMQAESIRPGIGRGVFEALIPGRSQMPTRRGRKRPLRGYTPST